MKKILHLVEDHQVVERSLDLYEKIFPNQNEVIIFANTNRYKHIKKHNKEILVTPDNYKKIARNFNYENVGCVIVHYMSYIKIEFIRLLPNDLTICWAVYGGDLYINYADILKHPLYYTNPLKYHKYSLLRICFNRIFNFILYVKTHDKSHLTVYRKRCLKYITQRTNVLLGDECDIKLIEKYSSKSYTYYSGSAYPLKETLKDLYYEDYSKGNDIMIGNSASYSNNHLYALTFLKELRIPLNYRIRLTLSYGGNNSYINDISKKYKKEFPENLDILTEYIPLSDYNKLFLKTKIYICSAWRQESFGTILMCFYFGIKVYISKFNPLYQSLTNKGFYIFLLEEIKDSFYNDISIEEKDYNKNLLIKLYDSETEENNRKKFFLSILS